MSNQERYEFIRECFRRYSVEEVFEWADKNFPGLKEALKETTSDGVTNRTTTGLVSKENDGVEETNY